MTSAARRADVDVVDLDPHSPHVVAHRDAVCAALRARERITWSTAHGGPAVAARDDDVRTVLLGPATFSSGVPGRVAVPPTDGDTGRRSRSSRSTRPGTTSRWRWSAGGSRAAPSTCTRRTCAPPQRRCCTGALDPAPQLVDEPDGDTRGFVAAHLLTG